MAESTPTRKDIESLFKKLRSIPSNKVCFDCTAKNPTWASVTYGVFICIDCSAVHRSLGVHLTFVRSTQLDTNWTWLQLRQMQLGGNSNAESFFHQHSCTTKDSQQKYNSRAAQLYKDKLYNAAVHSIQVFGAKIQLEQDTESHSLNKEKYVDFFDEHSSDPFVKENVDNSSNSFLSNVIESNESSYLSHNPSLSEDRCQKYITGNRKIHSKKTGAGSRKSGGLGAKKISTDFAEIEKEAELAGKMKEMEGKISIEKNAEKDDEQVASIRLMYEDLSLKKSIEEEKLKAVDPTKAKQMERLGMGFTARGGISHSALSDMKTIQQEEIEKQKTADRDVDDFFELDFSSNSNSNYLNRLDTRITSSITEKKEKSHLKFTDGVIQQREKKHDSSSAMISDEAQKKFGSAKSISSDQFFSNNADNTFERSATLSRFEGSSSISSADYFNRNENVGRSSGTAANLISNSLINAPDLDDVKESVRQGVTKVAGRISSLANGVMSSIQERYGGY